jgi:hypothetical protein
VLAGRELLREPTRVLKAKSAFEKETDGPLQYIRRSAGPMRACCHPCATAAGVDSQAAGGAATRHGRCARDDVGPPRVSGDNLHPYGAMHVSSLLAQGHAGPTGAPTASHRHPGAAGQVGSKTSWSPAAWPPRTAGHAGDRIVMLDEVVYAVGSRTD